ncbi:P2 family phage major capsid protein [Pseudomonas sp. SJZ085]|uniref:phage major capsid protein, P2 family n=1 Tax=unclassified Pseudomonas TaxID=196821 RepID=UPI00119ABFB7|nr:MULTISPECIES: phage major capsid protein, P2 family [unclassified Pseudomonas]TWC14773.1 P2 family phage major capsid protein [Pseudomonas sp. SJZ074]TWC33091.1 P2 family phage major capsid protein [Pseudomonas sp. SJZ085]
MSLSTAARLRFSTLALAIASTYAVESVREEFNVSPTHAQTLNEKITLSSSFLQRINVIPVSEIKGEKVMLGVNGSVTGRTNTTNADRVARNVLGLDGNGYELFETHSDVGLKYATIDAWAKFKDFAQRYAAAVQKQIGLDRIMIGWNGTSVAATTDRVANPLLQDVNKGWLQIAREQAPEQVMAQGTKAAGKIQIGATGDYANLDALVFDVSLMIEEEFRDGGDLIAIVGRDLLAYDKGKLYANQGGKPTEKERLEMAQVIATYGGLPTFTCPHFPSKGVVVTSWDNLSIYFQDSSWRRQIVENPKRSQVEDYNSRNEGYVIEQLGKFAAIEAAAVEFV